MYTNYWEKKRKKKITHDDDREYWLCRIRTTAQSMHEEETANTNWNGMENREWTHEKERKKQKQKKKKKHRLNRIGFALLLLLPAENERHIVQVSVSHVYATWRCIWRYGGDSTDLHIDFQLQNSNINKILDFYRLNGQVLRWTEWKYFVIVAIRCAIVRLENIYKHARNGGNEWDKNAIHWLLAAIVLCTPNTSMDERIWIGLCWNRMNVRRRRCGRCQALHCCASLSHN